MMVRTIVAVAAGSLVLAAGQANATPLFTNTGLSCSAGVCTETITGASTPTTALAGTFNIDYFDPNHVGISPAPGILTGVHVTIDATSTLTTGDVSVSGGDATDAKTNFYQTYGVSDLSGNTDISVGLLVHYGSSLNTTAIVDDLGAIASGNTAYVGGGYLGVGETNQYVLNFTDLSTWTSSVGGFDPVTFGTTSIFNANVSGSNTGYNSGGSFANGLTATVVYDYTTTSAPEPMTIAVLTTGLLGLTAARRRRRS